MFGNAIKQTTSSTGTGNLTLSSVSGYPQFSDVFALNQQFSYVLLDSGDKFIEAGIGYLSGSTTLVRAKVSSTYVSSTYNASTATAASLSGTTTVICALHAATTEAPLATVDSQSASVNRFLLSAHHNNSLTTQTMGADRLYYTPFLLRTGAQITALSISVATLAVGSSAKAGIYTCNEKGYIGSLLASVSGLDCTSTGVKTVSLGSPVFLPAGWYYIGFVATGAAPGLLGYASASASILNGCPLGFAGTTGIELRYETLAPAASLPSTANTTTTAQNVGVTNPPAVFLTTV